MLSAKTLGRSQHPASSPTTARNPRIFGIECAAPAKRRASELPKSPIALLFISPFRISPIVKDEPRPQLARSVRQHDP
jgi:hypothetical protein